MTDTSDRLFQDVVTERPGVLTRSPPASEDYHLTQRTSIGVIINYTYSYRDITISINIAQIQPEDRLHHT